MSLAQIGLCEVMEAKGVHSESFLLRPEGISTLAGLESNWGLRRAKSGHVHFARPTLPLTPKSVSFVVSLADNAELVGAIYGKLDGLITLMFFIVAVVISFGLVAMPKPGVQLAPQP